MGTALILALIKEFIYTVLVIGFLLWYVLYYGRQALINLIVGLYLALVFYYHAPIDLSQITADHTTRALVMIMLFIAMATASTAVVSRVMPEPFREKKFESFGKKVVLLVGAAILILVISFHVLPVSTLITLQSPIGSLFSATTYFFWWLLIPVIILYLHK